MLDKKRLMFFIMWNSDSEAKSVSKIGRHDRLSSLCGDSLVHGQPEDLRPDVSSYDADYLSRGQGYERGSRGVVRLHSCSGSPHGSRSITSRDPSASVC